MPSVTVQTGNAFGAISVGAYRRAQKNLGVAPTGAAVETQTAAGDGSVTFTTLNRGTAYTVYALVAGTHRYVDFRVDEVAQLEHAHLPGVDLTKASNSDVIGVDGLLKSVVSSSGIVDSTLTLRAAAAGDRPLTIKGAAGQSARLLSLTDSGGFEQAYFNPVGSLKLKLDAGDAYGNIVLENRTTTKSASGGTAWYRPGMHHWIDDGTTPRLRWQAPQLDVADSIGTGTGSRDGGSNAMFGDLVLAYRRDPVDSAQSQDFIYLVDERNGRIGFHRNVPVANYHFGGRRAATDAMTVDDAVGQDNWFLRFTRTDQLRGGFYNNATAGLSGALVLGGSTAPTEMLDVRGNALVQGLQLTTNSVTAFNSAIAVPFIYGSNSGGSYPFDTAGNLVLQPRVQSGTTTKDILLVTGDPPVPVLTISAASKNVAINQDTTAPTGLFGGGAGVIGIRNATTAPTTGSGGRPANGAVLFAQSSLVRIRVGLGSIAMGQTEPVNGHGGFQAGAADSNTMDVKLYRSAAAVWGTDSIFRFNVAGSWQTTVGAAGGGSALPATPTKYLKVQDEAGTTYVIPAYAAA